MIMAPTCKLKQRMDTQKPVLIQKPEWNDPNVGYIVTDKPIITINGREHYLIHWDNPYYEDEYIDISYVQKMEDVSKFRHNWHPPGELPLSPEQHDLAASKRKQGLKRICKARASWRTPPKATLEERLQTVAQPKGSNPK